MDTPWLSVIIPTFNGEKYIHQSICSILEQDDSAIEVIVIDDGSQDQTVNIIEGLMSTTEISIRLLKKEHCGNWIRSTNDAMDVATGKYICWLHQDDFWLTGRLEAIKEAIREKGSPDWIVHPVSYVDQYGNCVGRWNLPKHWNESMVMEQCQRSLMIQNCLSVPGVTFKRDLFLKNGAMNEELWYVGDWDYWIRFAYCSTPVVIPKNLAGFRIHAKSQTICRSGESASLQRQFDAILSRNEKHRDKESQKLGRLSAEINLLLLNSRYAKAITKMLAFLMFSPPRISRRFLNETRLIDRVSPRLRLSIRNLFLRSA